MKIIKEIVCVIAFFLLSILCGLSVAAEDAATSGAYGNLQWNFTDGVLTISGEGEMVNTTSTDYDYPWLTFDVKSIVVEEGITSLADGAFRGMNSTSFSSTNPTSLTVSLPSTLTTIGQDAFSYTNLLSIEIPDSVTSIGKGAFKQCYQLESLIISNGLTEIPEEFCESSALSEITIPDNITSIRKCAFYDCVNLKKVNLGRYVAMIGAEAFYNCSPEFTSIVLPLGLNSNRIADWCNTLETVILSDDYRFVPPYFFMDLKSPLLFFLTV